MVMNKFLMAMLIKITVVEKIIISFSWLAKIILHLLSSSNKQMKNYDAEKWQKRLETKRK